MGMETILLIKLVLHNYKPKLNLKTYFLKIKAQRNKGSYLRIRLTEPFREGCLLFFKWKLN